MRAEQYANALVAAIEQERREWLAKPSAGYFDYDRVMSGEIRPEELRRAREVVECEPPAGFPNDEAILGIMSTICTWERAALHEVGCLMVALVPEPSLDDRLGVAEEEVARLRGVVEELKVRVAEFDEAIAAGQWRRG